jgi:hypothetical protein
VHRDRKRAAIALGIGALCAASLLIYLPTIQKVKAWSDLLRYDINLAWIVARFREAADIGGGLGVWAWIAALIAAHAPPLQVARRARHPRLRLQRHARRRRSG